MDALEWRNRIKRKGFTNETHFDYTRCARIFSFHYLQSPTSRAAPTVYHFIFPFPIYSPAGASATMLRIKISIKKKKTEKQHYRLQPPKSSLSRIRNHYIYIYIHVAQSSSHFVKNNSALKLTKILLFQNTSSLLLTKQNPSDTTSFR